MIRRCETESYPEAANNAPHHLQYHSPLILNERSAPMRIGFIGLGMMGKPMAVNLLRAGHDVAVVNRSQGKVRELADMGARPCASPADAARGADVIALCLVGDVVVESVLRGEGGALEGAQPGAVALDHSTVHPEFARRMEAACAERGVVYLDAPVSGTGQVAWDGELTVMLGGGAHAMERARPALDAVSANARLMGPVGSGNMAKLVNNMVKDINQLGVMETLVLGAKWGLDLGLLVSVMRSGAAASRQLNRIAPKILSRTFEQTSYVSTNIKDQGLMGWMIGQAGMELPLRNAARDSWQRAADQGLAQADPTEAVKALEREAGVEVKGEMRSDYGRTASNPEETLDDLTAALYLAGVFEAFTLAAKLGMDAQAMFEVMRTASGASAQLERAAEVIFGGEPQASAPASVYASLYEPVLENARREGLRLPLHEASADVWRKAGGGDDAEVFARALGLREDAAGIRLRGA